MVLELTVNNRESDISQYRTESLTLSNYPPSNRRESLSNISLVLSSSETYRKRVPLGEKKLFAPKVPVVDPYRLLGVRRNSTCAEIYDAYMRLSLLYHPQRINYHHTATEEKDLEQKIRLWKFIVISACYETLSDIDYRTNYNFINQKPNGVNMNQHDSYSNFAFWEDVKRVLKISDSNEEFLDHDGVPCCYDFVNMDHQSAFIPRDETRDENEASPRGSIHISTRENSLVKPVMARDESDKTDPGHSNASTSETDHLFGGPLATLYKARDHEPFTDPICLFNREFGPGLFSECLGPKDQQSKNDNFDIISQKWLFSSTKESWQDQMFCTEQQSLDRKIYPSLPTLPQHILEKLCNEAALNSDRVKSSKTPKRIDGFEVTKKSRCVGNECIVRTERIKRDRLTGKTITFVEVNREPVSNECSSEMNSSVSICSPLPFTRHVDDIFDMRRFQNLLFWDKGTFSEPR